jgi:large subunit ribosomal protein L3
MLTVVPAKKLGMTSVFDGGGTTMPATVVEPFDVYVLRKKTIERDGYSAVVFAFEETAEKHVNKPHQGQLSKAGIDKILRRSFEVRMPAEKMAEFVIGVCIHPEEYLYFWGEANVTSVSKGRGFQGVMRRHNFRGVKATHGHTIHRKPASGGATDPARQLKGSRRPGHMGHENVTIKNLTIFEYDRLHNIIVLHGNVPGPKGGLVWVTMTKELEKEILDTQYQVYLEAKAEEGRIEAETIKSKPEMPTVSAAAAPVIEEPEYAHGDGRSDGGSDGEGK